MGFYLPLLFIPAFLVALVCRHFWPHHITFKEWLLQGAGVVVSTLICFLIIMASAMEATSDTSIFNGFVTGKESVHVSCSHQYVCGETCSTVTSVDSKGKSSSRRVCSPKYCDEHSYDVDWDVYSTLGTFTIDRVDRRGLREPERWNSVELAEPVAVSKYVENFLLLDRNRFNTNESIHNKYVGKLPSYPSPYDYYRYSRVIADNKGDYDGINIWLNEQLRKHGSEKQLNIILVVTRNNDDYFYALMEYWRGTKKNDVVLFYGIDDEENIKWARAMSFADGQNNQIMLKQLQSMTYDRKFTDDLVKEQYQLIVQDFKRVPNQTFAYLKNGWIPPTWVIVLTMLLNLAAAIGVAWFVIKEDVA